MKKFRSSFNHLIREKLIAGVDDTSPTPETRQLESLYPGLIIAHTGTFEYQQDDMTTTISGDTWVTQGSMSYGTATAGDNLRPYRSYMSNKIDNPLKPGTYTGSVETPEIVFGGLHHTGVGVTMATGYAQHYVIAADTPRHNYAPGTDHRLFSVYGVKAATNHTASATDHTQLSNGVIHFTYTTESDNSKSHTLHVTVTDETGTKSGQLMTNGLHFQSCYGRLLPVSLLIDTDGTIEFRVDGTVLSGNLSDLTNSDGTVVQSPIAGELHVATRALSPVPYTAPYSGMGAPITRLTNLAINDNDDSDQTGDVGLPPFVTGVPCTPLRSSSTDWELPLQVTDPLSGWTPYADSGTTVEYGLSAVADSQLFETRGVAANAPDKPLHVYTTNTQTLSQQLSSRGLPELSAVETVNTMLYDAAVIGDQHDMSVTLTTTGTYTPITHTKTLSGVNNNFTNTVVTFNTDATDQPMNIDTFNNGMVFSLTVDETAPTPTTTVTPTPTPTDGGSNEGGEIIPTPTPTATSAPVETLPVGLIGSCINGLSNNDYTGTNVVMSDDGNRVVITSPYDDRNGTTSGTIRVFERSGTDWQLMGGETNGYITGNTTVANNDADYFQFRHNDYQPNMHANGTADRIAVGSFGNNQARVYQWTGTQWSLMGGDNIPKDTSYDLSFSGYFGSSVRLNQTGDTLAVGEPYYDRMNFFQWNTSTNTWEPKGYVLAPGPVNAPEISDNGTSLSQSFGQLVSFNQTGDRVIVGGNVRINSVNRGVFKSYQWSGTVWTYMNEIVGPQIGTMDQRPSSVDMNSTGDRVVIGYNQYLDGPGQAVLYQWNSSTDQWDDIGAVSGDNQNDRFGWKVSINGDGDVIAVGADYWGDNSEFETGQVKIFSWDGSKFNMIAEHYGPRQAALFGSSVSLNRAGDRVAVGAAMNQGASAAAGQCCVYQLPQNNT